MTDTPLNREKNLIAAVNHAHTAIQNVTKELEEIGEFDETLQSRVIDYLRTSVDDAQRYLTYLQGRNGAKFSLDWEPQQRRPIVEIRQHTARTDATPAHATIPTPVRTSVPITGDAGTRPVSVTRTSRARVFNPEGRRVFADCTDEIVVASRLMDIDGADFLDEGPAASSEAAEADDEPDFQ